MKRIMLLGLGALGSRVFSSLLLQNPSFDIHVCVRDAQRARPQFNASVLAAFQQGFRDVKVNLVELDVSNESDVAKSIAAVRPDIIFSAVTRQSWWVIGELPPAEFKRLSAAEVGPWLPMHLSLVRHLMRAAQDAGYDGHVVNAAFPDVVHPALAEVGLSPTVGIGNVANNVPALTYAFADQLHVAPSRLIVRVVMHHFASHRISRHGNSGGAPYALSVELDGQDVTGGVEIDDALRMLPSELRRLRGVEGTVMTAASATKVLLAVLRGSDEVLHAPGPAGLPGGYPIRFVTGRPVLDLPKSLSRTQAVQINLAGHRFEGVDEIAAGGLVRFREENAAVLAEELGYDCPSMRVDDCDLWADELARKYAEYRSQLLTRV